MLPKYQIKTEEEQQPADMTNAFNVHCKICNELQYVIHTLQNRRITCQFKNKQYGAEEK